MIKILILSYSYNISLYHSHIESFKMKENKFFEFEFDHAKNRI